jgi:superfamily II DNA or RNA helicase
MPSYLFDFQGALTEWGIKKGRGLIAADCGMGKTVMSLVWSQNVVIKTNKPVIIFAPLAVSMQTSKEANKFDIECEVSSGKYSKKIITTNYEKLKHFNWQDFGGVVCDESSILKSFNGKIKNEITQFLKKIPYRLLTTATAAPNDYIELGTSSEALGYLGFMDMLNRFFKNDSNNSALRRQYGEAPKWRFCGHSEQAFWRWVCSWSRACRMPSDLGFDNGKFILPKLTENTIVVDTRTCAEGTFLPLPAKKLDEQREERRRTINERCEKVAEIINNKNDFSFVMCQLNQEGDLLEKLIKDSVQVHGRHKIEQKEERLFNFADGKIKCLITKPKIGAWGMNYQHCNHVAYFPSHSYEQYYQTVRRCWRFGQKRPVRVDLVMTEGDELVMKNMQRKMKQAEEMFKNLVAEMNNELTIKHVNKIILKQETPSWL